MLAVVIGGDGFVGRELVTALKASGHDVIPTTRRSVVPAGWLAVDLAQPVNALPDNVEVVFIVAAVGTFQGCEGNPESYRINVDAPIDIARIAKDCGACPVFVSSDCVEWCGSTAYARQKSLAEIGVRMAGGIVVRPARIAKDRVSELCDLLVRVGERRDPGVYRWA